MKVWNYVVIIMGLAILFYIAGIGIEGQSAIFNLTGVQTNDTGSGVGQFNSNLFSISDFFKNIFSKTVIIGILAGLGLAGIVAGISGGRYSVENFIILPFITGVLALFIQVMLGVINNSIASGQSWVAAIVVALLVPFMVAFALALVEFFRGTD